MKHVSRSQLLDSIAERLTSGISGLRPSESFAEYDRDTCCWRTSQASLLTGTLAEYSGTWPKQGTMRNGSVSEPRTSARPIEGNGFSLWQTPDAMGGGRTTKGSQRPNEGGLTKQASMWPTPDTQVARDGSVMRAAAKGSHAVSLHHKVAMWPTPKARDSKPGGLGAEMRRHSPDLNSLSLQVPTTSMPGHECSPKCRRLSPRFVEWLMKFPIGWTALPDSETP